MSQFSGGLYSYSTKNLPGTHVGLLPKIAIALASLPGPTL